MDVRPLAPERGHRQCSRGMVGRSLWSLPLPATHTQDGGITLSRDKCPLGGVTLTLRWATGKCIRSRAGLAIPWKDSPLLGTEDA